jgi:hypothetical protein
MRIRRVENVIVTVHTSKAPSSEEWSAYLEAVLAAGRLFGNDLGRCRHLVFTDGGGPDADQRAAAAKMSDQMNGKTMPVAVLTTVRFVRVIVTALHWLGIRIQACHPAEIRAVLDSMGLGPATTRALWTDLNAMDQELGGIEAIHVAREAFQRG